MKSPKKNNVPAVSLFGKRFELTYGVIPLPPKIPHPTPLQKDKYTISISYCYFFRGILPNTGSFT
jgi:hypothetical protein